MVGFGRVWAQVVRRIAGLPADITPHVLRHSCACLAADLGLADATITVPLRHSYSAACRRFPPPRSSGTQAGRRKGGA